MITTHFLNANKSLATKNNILFEELSSRGFRQVQTLHIEDTPSDTGVFVAGKIYYWKKNGDCIVCMLRDGRVLVIYGPASMWQLLDELSDHEIQVLDAFCSLGVEDQSRIRQLMMQSGVALHDVFQSMTGKQEPCFQNFIHFWNVSIARDNHTVFETQMDYGYAKRLFESGSAALSGFPA